MTSTAFNMWESLLFDRLSYVSWGFVSQSLRLSRVSPMAAKPAAGRADMTMKQRGQWVDLCALQEKLQELPKVEEAQPGRVGRAGGSGRSDFLVLTILLGLTKRPS